MCDGECPALGRADAAGGERDPVDLVFEDGRLRQGFCC
jgi:hypothetical protein